MASKSKRTTLATAVTLTGSAAVIGNTLDTRLASEVTFLFTLTLGTGGSSPTVVTEVQGSLTDDGSDWVAAESVSDVSGAISAALAIIPSGVRKRSYDTAGDYSVTVSVGAFRRLRVKAYETGSPSPFGALTIVAAKVVGL